MEPFSRRDAQRRTARSGHGQPELHTAQCVMVMKRLSFRDLKALFKCNELRFMSLFWVWQIKTNRDEIFFLRFWWTCHWQRLIYIFFLWGLTLSFCPSCQKKKKKKKKVAQTFIFPHRTVITSLQPHFPPSFLFKELKQPLLCLEILFKKKKEGGGREWMKGKKIPFPD